MRGAQYLVSLAVLLPAAARSLAAQQVSLPAGTALRVALDRHVRIHKGATVTGHLTQPVYLSDHEVLPIDSSVTGTIEGTHPGTKAVHIRRILAADFTPPREADIVFNTVTAPAQGNMPARIISIQAPAKQTDAAVLTLGTRNQKRSLKGQVSESIGQAKQQAGDLVKHHEIKEIIEKWAIGQLPYHPEILWTKTRFNADLTEAVDVTDVPHIMLPVEDLRGRLADGTLRARLLSPVTSATAKRGDAVEAVTTQPLLSPDGTRVLVPEGTRLHGSVVQTKAARSWGRNGSLRFTFGKLDLATAQNQARSMDIHGRLSAAETAPSSNISMDEEGQTKANDTPAKYIEPALLTVLAAGAGPDGEHPGTAAPGAAAYSSNGMGLISRVVSLGTRDTNVIQGFAYYSLAKSVFYRFVAKGHDTSFDHDTEIQISLSER